MASALFSTLRRFLLLAALAGACSAVARAQGYGDGFDPNGSSNIYAMVRQPDGKVIIGGNFSSFEQDHYGVTVSRERIARLNRDGSIDSTFTSYVDDDISALALQPDGKILIAGKFKIVGSGTGETTRTGIARLNADGSVDTSFVQVNPAGFGYYPQAVVRSIAVQADGKVLIGGGFSSLQPTGSSAPIARNRIARLNTDGTVDTSFDAGANNVVLAILIQPDGRIVLGGGFTTIKPTGFAGATLPVRNRIARLNTDGTLDNTFAPSLDNRVLALARQVDGKLLVGGEFIKYTAAGAAADTASDATFLLRLNDTDGAQDTTFKPKTSGAVESFSIQADGRIIVGGRFTWVQSTGSGTSTIRTNLARFFADGVVDPDFFPSPTGSVAASIVQPDGTIVIGGYFTAVGSVSGATLTRGRVARLLPDGNVDSAFRSSRLGAPYVVAELADGNLLVAGSFPVLGGVTRYSLAKVAPDGTVLPGFKPVINGTIFALRVLADGRLLIGGSFTRIDGVPQRYIARLAADGTLDTTFKPEPNASVYAITVQGDGRILIGGNFTTVQPNGATEATTRKYIARLAADGTVDTAFDPSANLTVNSIVIQSDNKILIGGDFYSLQPNGAKKAESYYYAARLETTGLPDPTFVPRPNASVARVVLQGDGKVVLCGTFTSVLPGKATTATTRRYIARFNADSSLDTAFDPNPNAAVYNVDLLSGGGFLLQGSFSTFQSNGATTSTAQRYLAWLTSAGALDTTRVLTPDTSVSLAKALSDGRILLGGAFGRLTTGSGQIHIVTESLTRVTAAAALDPTFVLNSGGAGSAYIGALARQIGGRVYTGGSFAEIAGSTNAGISRFFNDGVPDNSFTAKANGTVHAIVALETSEDEEEEGGPVTWLESSGVSRTSFGRSGAAQLNGSVYAVAVQADNKVLVGGEFTDTGATATTVGNLSRLNADGTLDDTFNPEPDAAVQAIAVQPDGRILVGGNFTVINGISRSRLARLLPTGVIESAITWDPKPNGTVLAIVHLADGKILIGGTFTTLSPNGATTAISRPYLARLNADGTVDTAFNAELNAQVNAIIVQDDGKYVVGGAFTTVKGASRNYLARLGTDGALDTAFNPNPNGAVDVLALQPSGMIVVTGAFSSFTPNSETTATKRSSIARIAIDGSLDTVFHPIPNNWVEDVGIQSDGSILLTGAFSAMQLEEGGDAYRRNHLVRFHADGTLDPLFNPNANGTINAIDVRADNSLVIGGSFDQLRPSAVVIAAGDFTTISDSPTPYLARINDDGSADAYFNPAPNAIVRALAEQLDGSVLVGGDFTQIASQARTRLARLLGDGAIDLTFAPAVDGPVHSLAVQPDDRVLIGGLFNNVAGASRTNIARLLAGGAIDAGFAASTDAAVSAIATQPDGRILIAGAFTQVNGTGRSYLARLATNGTLDAAFTPAFDGVVHTVAVQADGRILVGGAFTQAAGQARSRLARLNVDGSLDATFTIPADGDVRVLLLEPDGKVLAGGSFGSFAGRRTPMLGRVANPTPLTQSATLSTDLSTFTWTSTGSAPEFSTVALAQSADGRTWTNLGAAARTSGGAWQISGLTTLSSDAFNYIRARAVQVSSPNGSSGRFEQSWQFFGSTAAGPASLLNSGGAAAGWTDGGGSGTGGSGGSGGSGGGTGGTGGSSSSGVYHLSNLSIRAWPADGQPFVAGLVIGGSSSQKVLLRAVGPGLTAFGVDPVMTEPRMSLVDRNGALLSTALSWTGDTAVAATAVTVGAFPLEPSSDDSAVVRTLDPGAYTIHVDAGSGLNGIALGEIYFAGETGGLANFSARAPAGAGTGACVAGFVVGGDQPRRFLIRGVGPALAAFGISDAATDTVLRLYDATGAQIAINDDWEQQTNATAGDITTAATTAGAFALPGSGKDAAIVIELAPGAYTAHVGGAAAGTVLAEVYELP